jgi:hypothetical protein
MLFELSHGAPRALRRRIESRLAFLNRRTWIQIAAVGAVFPLFALAIFYGFVCVARIDLGHWPVFNDPYPKFLPSKILRIGIGLNFYTFPVVSAVAVFWSLIGRWRYSDFPMWKLLSMTFASAALASLVFKLDPGSFVNWFID